MEERKKQTPIYIGSKLLKNINKDSSERKQAIPIEANASGSLSTRANSNIKPYIEAFNAEETDAYHNMTF